ncbi:MAG: ABC transporter permease [Vicinamibacteria bacterium]
MLSLISPRRNIQAFREGLQVLISRRYLIYELARREVSDRYAGQFFSRFWTIGHPLILLTTYVFVFGYIFKTRMGGTAGQPFDYTSYLLAGLIPWLAFQEVMAKAGSVIVANANLVKQVIFPIEVLPVKSVVSTLPSEMVLLFGLALFILARYFTLPLTWALLPLLFAMQVLAMTGVSFALSAVGAYFRDIKDVVQVFNVVGIYFLPAIYLPGSVPRGFELLLLLNPFSHLVYCFQDALYFGAIRHPFSWLIFFSLSLVSFISGHRLFRRLSAMFGNVL